MFHDLKRAWRDMITQIGFIATDRDDEVLVSFPRKVFDRFEQEFSLCFIEEDDDNLFKMWQDSYDEDDD